MLLVWSLECMAICFRQLASTSSWCCCESSLLWDYFDVFKADVVFQKRILVMCVAFVNANRFRCLTDFSWMGWAATCLSIFCTVRFVKDWNCFWLPGYPSWFCFFLSPSPSFVALFPGFPLCCFSSFPFLSLLLVVSLFFSLLISFEFLWELL